LNAGRQAEPAHGSKKSHRACGVAEASASWHRIGCRTAMGSKWQEGHGTPSLGTAFIPTSLTWKTERVSPSSHMNRFCAPTPSSVPAHACCYSLVRSHSFVKARRHHHSHGFGHRICGRSRSRSSLPFPFPLPSPSRGADLSRRYLEAIDRFALTEPQACTRSRFAIQTIRGLTIMSHQS
jgi:hypothetical protein